MRDEFSIYIFDSGDVPKIRFTCCHPGTDTNRCGKLAVKTNNILCSQHTKDVLTVQETFKWLMTANTRSPHEILSDKSIPGMEKYSFLTQKKMELIYNLHVFPDIVKANYGKWVDQVFNGLLMIEGNHVCYLNSEFQKSPALLPYIVGDKNLLE